MIDFERAKRMVLERANAASFQSNACVELIDMIRRIENVAGEKWRDPIGGAWHRAGLEANVAMIAHSSINVPFHHKFEKRLARVMTRRLPDLMPFLVLEMIRDLANDAGLSAAQTEELIEAMSANESLLTTES